MNAQVNYLKDKNGNVVSPVVSTDSVYDANGNKLTKNLSDINTNILSIQTTIGTMNDTLDNINGEVI